MARSPADALGLPLAKKIKKDEHPAVNGLMRRTPPKENGVDHLNHKKDPVSPPSGHSSASSTPAPPKKNGDDAKPPTPKSGGQRSPSSMENGSPPSPPDAPGYPRPSYDPAHSALRPPPALGLGSQPATGKSAYSFHCNGEGEKRPVPFPRTPSWA